VTASVRTVLGVVAADRLGVTDSHDHLFLTTPALPGDELDDVRDASAVLERFVHAGGRTLVQWSPHGTRRRLDALVELSARHDVHVVAATGRHRAHVHGNDAPIATQSGDELAATFIADVEHHGCGLVKVGTGRDAISPFERESLRAAAVTTRETGVPIGVHLEGGTAAEAVLDVLAADEVDPDRVVLGHLGRNADPAAALDAASRGAWLCLDLPTPEHGTTPGSFLTLLELLWSHGHADRLLLGADTTTATARALRRDASTVPETAVLAEQRIGDDLGRRLLVDNPARAWSVRPRVGVAKPVPRAAGHRPRAEEHASWTPASGEGRASR